MEIYVTGDDRILVSWGDKGPLWSLTSDGAVTEQLRVQGELVWQDGDEGFDVGYHVGREEGLSEGYKRGAEEAVNPTAVAS